MENEKFRIQISQLVRFELIFDPHNIKFSIILKFSFLFFFTKITPVSTHFITDFYLKNTERILKIVGVYQLFCKLLYQEHYVIHHALVNVLQHGAFKQNKTFNYRNCCFVYRAFA